MRLRYLIGVIVKQFDKSTRCSLWADSRVDEKAIFEKLVAMLLECGDAPIYHYGSHEIRVLARVFKDHCFDPSVLSEIAARSVNLLSHLHHDVYVPTYTNELKEVARYCGFEWSHKKSSGIQSILWRKQWEMSSRSRFNKLLLRYNMEDCQALIVVKDWLEKVRERVDSDVGRFEGIHWLPDKTHFWFGKNHFLIPDFEMINDCAYFDFQTKVVLPKTNPSLDRQRKRLQMKSSQKPKANVQAGVTFPETCPYCGHDRFYRHCAYHRQVVYLRWMKDGVKRWVTKYDTGNLRCRRCRKIATPERLYPGRFGRNVFLWATHLNITYALSFRAIVRLLSETFRINLTQMAIHRCRGVLAQEYRRAYDEIMEDMVKGSLIHVDETQAKIGRSDGYIWVFANPTSVCYMYRPSIEAGFLKGLLGSFAGVLVSDFYSGYDSLRCAHQKCLIHLIRDINDDLLKNPLDAELRHVAISFANVLGPIVDTINHHGLKRKYLKKHKKRVTLFFQELAERNYGSESASRYRERLIKNRHRLFTFLDYDGVPWNNNNAEHGIKRFVKYRSNVFGPVSAPRSEEHLIFLSISQTCEYRGLNFLDFLRSGQKTITDFERTVGSNRHSRKSGVTGALKFDDCHMKDGRLSC